jgi:non-specific serine/threonine protein kinase/serine/threonine-protein kinase
MNDQPTKDEMPAMTPERWQQIKPLFEQALEYEADERKQFLAQACAADVELRAQLEALLQGHEEASTFIEKPAAQAARLFDAPSEDSFIGLRVGPYKVLREIGHGGMGRVYLGVRADDEYKKRVALKVIKRGMDSKDIVRRFRHERQILASLDHPNIGKLLDGGTTNDGLPYFAMEYVEGQPITDYCDSHKLSTIERLHLFRQVCAAVQFAHQNLVVHRDLKPSNILVTEDGTPKLLDFGIAKLLNPELSGQTIDPTATAMRLMTPEYASPEQVRGETITTASDVYSLGVVLYELLTGHRPYHVKSRAPHDILRIVCEEEPERPSTAVNRVETIPSADGSTRAITPETVSRVRESEPEKLRRRLRGDLDNIVLMAMRKEPQRRYTTVNQLSEDIRRHLEGLPVIARKDTLAYRLEKFAQRNRGVAIACVAVFLTLLSGIVATTWQARVASKERERAERRFNDVRQLANSLMFELHDDIAKLAGSTPVREKLVKQALQYLDSLADEGGGDLSLRLELATAYTRMGSVLGNPNGANLGNTNGAFASYRKAVAISEDLMKTHAAEPKVRRSFAAANQELADMLAMTGNPTEAAERYRRSNEIYATLFAADPKDAALGVDLARGYLKLGDMLGNPVFPNLNDSAGALENFRQSFAIAQAVADAAPSNARARQYLYLSHERIGDIHRQQREYDRALAGYQQSAAITEQLLRLDPDNFIYRRHLVVLAQKSSAILLDNKQDAAAAQKELDKAWEITRQLVKVDPRNVELRGVLAYCHERQAAILTLQGNTAGAIENYRQQLEIYQSLRTPDPLNVKWRSAFLGTAQTLATHLDKAGRKEEAARIKSNVLAARKELANQPGATAEDLNGYAWDLLTIEPPTLRDPAAARTYAERAVALSKRQDAGLLDTLALAYYQTGEPQRAIATEEEALALLKGESSLRQELEANLRKFKTGSKP